ncbi:hypothetical protein SDC9_163590 [bioreactor metagenome]|uniref:Uncharacterized protein n=1 Tax=bioreactor metagenome TaxID=1076179 RepID=A0A645FRL1_9ZZZZ
MGISIILPDVSAISPLMPASWLIWLTLPLAPEFAIMYTGFNLSRLSIRALVTSSLVFFQVSITCSYLSSFDMRPLLYIFSILSTFESASESNFLFVSGMSISLTPIVTAPLVE